MRFTIHDPTITTFKSLLFIAVVDSSVVECTNRVCGKGTAQLHHVMDMDELKLVERGSQRSTSGLIIAAKKADDVRSLILSCVNRSVVTVLSVQKKNLNGPPHVIKYR